MPATCPHRSVRISHSVSLIALSLLTVAQRSRAQDTVATAMYAALRSLTLGSESVSLSNVDLKRDAGTFRFRSGTVCFAAPVNDKITGAVFVGDGQFLLDPPFESERKTLQLLTKGPEFNEHFERLLLRFTDSTYDELKKAGAPPSSGCDANLLKDGQTVTRHKIKRNLELEILGELLSPQPRNLFVAFIHGKNYDDKEIFELDPNQNAAQVDFWTYDENKYGDWASFNFTEPHTPGSVGRQVRMEHHELDTTFEKFFNEYVYGTQLPSYKFDSTLGTDPDGTVVLSFKLSQFNVDGKFAMLVPIYLELEDGRVIMLTRAPVIGSTTFSDKVSLKALKTKPRRAMINYHYDVLASN